MRKVQTNDRLTSSSGRELAPVPRLAFDTDRKAFASLRRLDAWLAQEARLEAANDEWLSCVVPKGDKLTEAERQLCNDILFGDVPRTRPFLKPLVEIL